MIHGINAHHRIEGFIVKWQALIHIPKLEFDIRYMGIKCMLVCRLNSLLIDIQTSNLAFEFPGKIKSRSTGTTGYLQDVIASREIEPTVENIIFIGGDPTVLTNIVPIGFSSYCCQHLFFEVAIGAVVQ